MLSEITVIIKDEEKTLKKKHLIYEAYEVSESDPILSQCIRETEKEFDGDASNIQVRILMSVPR